MQCQISWVVLLSVEKRAGKIISNKNQYGYNQNIKSILIIFLMIDIFVFLPVISSYRLGAARAGRLGNMKPDKKEQNDIRFIF